MTSSLAAPGFALAPGSRSRGLRPLVTRSDRTVVGQWWWTIDRSLLLLVLTLFAVGLFMVSTTSPVAAARNGFEDPLHFAFRQVFFVALAIPLTLGLSLLSKVQVRRAALLLMLAGLGMLVLCLVVGHANKGAARWIHLGFLTLQPSEFVKPAFAVTVAWLYAHALDSRGFPGFTLAMMLFAIVAGLLMLQPDLGQTVLLFLIFGGILFLAGLRIVFILGLGCLGVAGLIAAYFAHGHVRSRIDRFLSPESGDTFQYENSLRTIEAGGLLGRGPYGGAAKWSLPDAHTDFVFSVAIEELGLIFALAIVALYAALVIRGFQRLVRQHDLFVLLAGCGLLIQFGAQAMIHMASCLLLIPPKGMTLPFLSYGGSSMLALSISAGFLLALTRRSSPIEDGL